jgi:hypothetical protein
MMHDRGKSDAAIVAVKPTNNAGQRIALFANSRAGGSATVDAVLAAKQTSPDLIVAGAPKIGFIFGNNLPIKYPSSILANIKNGTYSFLGEILYTHGDKPDHPPTPRGEVTVDPLAPGTTLLLNGLRGKTVPLLTHWEAWAWERDWPRFDKLYANWPQQRFVLPSLAYATGAGRHHPFVPSQCLGDHLAPCRWPLPICRFGQAGQAWQTNVR